MGFFSSPKIDTSLSDPKERVAEFLDRQIKASNIPGIQYLIVDANSIQFQYSGGVLDVAENSKVQDSSKFLSSSTTKVLTAAAIWKLSKKKQVELDSPLSNYYTKHPYGNQVTIRQLLNHSSGIPNPIPVNWLHVVKDESTKFDEDEALQQALEQNPNLKFSPGEKYSYSNLSYWLLGKVIEQVSGMTYADYMSREIFAPLNISADEMTFENAALDTTAIAQGHQKKFSGLTFVFWCMANKEIWDTSFGKWARFQKRLCMNGPSYGGAIGTAGAYAKFLQDMLIALQTNGKSSKLFDGSVKDLIQPDYNNDGTELLPTTSGGWHEGSLNNQRYFGKPGGGPGFSSNVRIYPDIGLASIYLCNKTEVSEGPISDFSNTIDQQFLLEFQKTRA